MPHWPALFIPFVARFFLHALATFASYPSPQLKPKIFRANTEPTNALFLSSVSNVAKHALANTRQHKNKINRRFCGQPAPVETPHFAPAKTQRQLRSETISTFGNDPSAKLTKRRVACLLVCLLTGLLVCFFVLQASFLLAAYRLHTGCRVA